METLRGLPLLLVCAACAACAPAIGLSTPVTHPTPGVERHSVGLAVGGMYASSGDQNEDQSIVLLPHGEGWVRVPAGSGQIDFHVVPGLATLGYRFDIKPLSSGGTGIALEPAAIASLLLTTNDPDNADSDTDGTLFLGAGMTLLVMVPTGGGFFYLAPKIALVHGQLIFNDSEVGDDSVNILSLAGAIGIDLGTAPLGASLEIGIQRSSSLDSEDGSQPVWMVIPSVAMRL